MKITKEQLINLGACQAGIDWFTSHRYQTLRPLMFALVKDNHFNYARWLLVRVMTYPQKVKWAIFAAEQVLSIFEKKHPKDKRPRQALQAAKDFLAGKIDANAADAAANAAYAAYAANAADAATHKETETVLVNHALTLLGE